MLVVHKEGTQHCFALRNGARIGDRSPARHGLPRRALRILGSQQQPKLSVSARGPGGWKMREYGNMMPRPDRGALELRHRAMEAALAERGYEQGSKQPECNVRIPARQNLRQPNPDKSGTQRHPNNLQTQSE